MITIEIKPSNILPYDFSGFVSFKYDSNIVNALRELPQKSYLKDTMEWEIPVNKISGLVKQFINYEITIKGKLSELNPKETIINYPDNFKFKTKAFEHQLQGINYGLSHNKWLLADEQGCGKSKQVIDIAIIKKLSLNYKHCLIVCGVNTLKWNWVNEIHTHSNEGAWILGQKCNRCGKVKIGSTKDKLDDLIHMEKYSDDFPYFIITNIESFRDENIAEQINKLCKLGIINMCAADEMHKCFDYNTQIRTDKGLLKIGEIVTSKIKCNVLSYNENSKSFEYKPITNYFENFVNERLMCLTIKTENGEVVKIKCTNTHKFYTRNRGWVCAKDLTEFDDIVSIYT